MYGGGAGAGALSSDAHVVDPRDITGDEIGLQAYPTNFFFFLLSFLSNLHE